MSYSREIGTINHYSIQNNGNNLKPVYRYSA